MSTGNVVLDKIIGIISKRRFNKKIKDLSKTMDIPKELEKKSLENNKLLLRDKAFILDLIYKIAKNKEREIPNE
jgi:hypothetical protein